MSAAIEPEEKVADHVCWGHGRQCGHPHRLEVRDLVIRYRETLALERISFQTQCGQVLALVGPNGAGKSSLLKALAGLLRPQAGTILWRGAPLTHSTHELAYLPQREDVDWNFPLTVGALVEMGRYPSLRWWRPFRHHDREVVGRGNGPSLHAPWRRKPMCCSWMSPLPVWTSRRRPPSNDCCANWRARAD
jgi:hypothetical protein